MQDLKEKIFFFPANERCTLAWGKLEDLKVQNLGPSVLTRKHHTTTQLSFIKYSELRYCDLALLKFWKENNFLVLLDLMDLYETNGWGPKNFLRLCLKRAPVLLTVDQKFVSGALKGPIHLNKALEVFALKNKFDLKKLMVQARKGAAFLFLKVKTVPVSHPESWTFSERFFEHLYG